MIRFGREICGDLAQAERREWWLANGLGGYAAGTIAGTLTRRYHGLLVAPVNPPLGRHLVLAKADATLRVGRARSWPLFTNRWSGGAIDSCPVTSTSRASSSTAASRCGATPAANYASSSRIWMEYGEQHDLRRVASAARIRPSPNEPVQLRVKLLVNARDFHGAARPWDFNPGAWKRRGPELSRRASRTGSRCTSRRAAAVIATRHDWFENFDLSVERERGLSDRDSHLCVGEAELTLHPGEWVGVVGEPQSAGVGLSR